MIESKSVDFGTAIKAMKDGKKVRREGWPVIGSFLYYVPAASYPAQRNKYGTMVGLFTDDMVPYQAYIAIKTYQHNVEPWVATQSDILAEDWEVLV